MLGKFFTKRPTERMELNRLIRNEIASRGPTCSLNHIDVSKMTDMSYMFHDLDFQGDISKWNVSNVKRMEFMFYKSTFNGDISNWNVSNVQNMTRMFTSSAFNGDLSKWDMRNVDCLNGMFMRGSYTRELNAWDVQSVQDMRFIFLDCPYQGDISKWNIRPDCLVNEAFNCFHPSALGISSLIANPSIEVPETLPNAERLQALRTLWHSMGLSGIEQAQALLQTLSQESASMVQDIPNFEF